MSAIDPSAQSLPLVGGGGGLPTASGAGQVPVSDGAGTTYTATDGSTLVSGVLDALYASIAEGDFIVSSGGVEAGLASDHAAAVRAAIGAAAPWTTAIAPDDGQTTDATQTTIATIATTSNKGHALDLVVSATQSDRSAQVTFKILASVTNVAGTCTVRNQLITADDGGASGWAAVLDVSGTSIRVRVTGAGATTIDWIVAGTMLVHGS